MAGLEAALATGGGQPVSSAQLSPALQAVEAAARAQASDELIPAQHMPDLHKVGTLPPHPTLPTPDHRRATSSVDCPREWGRVSD